MEGPIQVTKTFRLYRFDQLDDIAQIRAVEQFIHEDNMTIEDNEYSEVTLLSYACTMMNYIKENNVQSIMDRIMAEKPLFFKNGTIVDKSVIEPLTEIKPS